ncbi:hypothetical protein GWG65_31735 [Bradyrhizobium sp. CSA207]|nr:hypothetical protein [Bradyrhizobium sp. CSA207]
MPHHRCHYPRGGESSTPRPFRIRSLSLEYWMPRPSAQVRTRRGMTAGLGEAALLKSRSAMRRAPERRA